MKTDGNNVGIKRSIETPFCTVPGHTRAVIATRGLIRQRINVGLAGGAGRSAAERFLYRVVSFATVLILAERATLAVLRTRRSTNATGRDYRTVFEAVTSRP